MNLNIEDTTLGRDAGPGVRMPPVAVPGPTRPARPRALPANVSKPNETLH